MHATRLALLVGLAGCVPVLGGQYACELNTDCDFGFVCEQQLCVEPSGTGGVGGNGGTAGSGGSAGADGAGGAGGDPTRWTIDIIQEGVLQVAPDLVLGADGTEHLTYARCSGCGDGFGQEYAVRSANGFEHEDIDSQSNDHGAIVVDAGGTPHIVYRDNDELRWARREGNGTWSDEPIALLNNLLVDAALDPEGDLHVIYVWDNALGGEVRHLEYTASNWETRAPLTSSGQATGVAVTISDDGDVHVAYTLLDSVVYARRRSGTWETFPIESANRIQHPGLAVDAGGDTHVVWYLDDSIRQAARYALFDGNDFSTPETIYGCDPCDGADEVGAFPSIAVDETGTVHVAFSMGGFSSDNALMYATPDTGGWDTDIITSGFDTGEWTTIAVDGAGTVKIAYLNYRTLELARR